MYASIFQKIHLQNNKDSTTGYLEIMENSILGNWSWRAIKLYHLTYGKLPPVILDLSSNEGTREIHLIARKPKWYLIPWVILVALCFLFQLIVNPYVLLKYFYGRKLVQLDALEIVLCQMAWVTCTLVIAESHIYLENWNSVPFLNLMMSNQLGCSKFSHPEKKNKN